MKKLNKEALIDNVNKAKGFAIKSAKQGTEVFLEKAEIGKDIFLEKSKIGKDVFLEKAMQGKEIALEKAEQAKHEYDIRTLKPAFLDTILTEGVPKMIRITEIDKKHKENPICEDSIGHLIDAKGMNVLNLYKEHINDLGVEFYPSADCDVYYVDPCNSRRYISLNDYFSYLKKVRVDELNLIAQALGAKHFKISVKAEKKVFVNKKENGKGKFGKVANADAERSNENKSFESIEVASELTFEGHEPTKPKLLYFKNESDIKSLIDMRMNKDNPVKSITLNLKYNNTSGIKSDAAVKIDAALTKLKIGGNASIQEEVQEEGRMYFEYAIEF